MAPPDHQQVSGMVLSGLANDVGDFARSETQARPDTRGLLHLLDGLSGFRL